MGRIKREIWTKEQIEEYLADKYPNGLRATEQEEDIRIRKEREKEVDEAVNKIISIIEGKGEGD